MVVKLVRLRWSAHPQDDERPVLVVTPVFAPRVRNPSSIADLLDASLPALSHTPSKRWVGTAHNDGPLPPCCGCNAPPKQPHKLTLTVGSAVTAQLGFESSDTLSEAITKIPNIFLDSNGSALPYY